MKIGAYLKFSLIDYPGNPSAVIFTKGCNMSCPYCHNYDLDHHEDIEVTSILAHLEKRKHILHHVVISGGEPTLHSDLPDFCQKIKALGYTIKLDTNGTNPQMLNQLLENKLVDYIAMDIKTSTEKYEDLTSINGGDILLSTEIIKQHTNYEFRTTCYPKVAKDDIKHIINQVGHQHLVLQNYRKNHDSDITPYPHTTLEAWAKEFNVKLR